MSSVRSILATIVPAAAATKRSLPLCLIGGVTGYALAELLIS